MQKLINKINNKEKGITLIALVITIVILLILAGVSIAMLTGDNGIITRANEASEKTKYAGAKEAVEAEIAGSLDNKGKYDANIAKANLEKNLGATVILNPDGTLDVYHGGYHFKVSADGKVTSIEKEEGTETSGTKFKQVSSGYKYTLALDEKGKIWSWGDNSEGQLGNGKSNEVVIKPTKINSDTEYVQVVANGGFSLALDREGNIWTWGQNINGQLGNGDSGGYGKNVLIPTRITNGIKYTQIETTTNGGVALDSEGNIWTWGSNSYGQLGNGSKGEAVLVPTKVTNGVKYTQISGGSSNVLALDSEGNLWTWGYNYHGQLGNGLSGTNANVLVPTKITNGIKYTQISAGIHCLALDNEGNIWSWGYNSDGQLGNGLEGEDVLIPTKVTNGTKYIQIEVGYGRNSLALDSEGNIWSWGDNGDGELGNGKRKENVLIPTKVTSGKKYVQISTGNGTSLALDEEGNIWGCGENDYGQLGLEQTAMYWTQTTVKLNKISTNGEDSAGLDEKGNIWTWGSSSGGQLGNGSKGEDVLVQTKVTDGIEYVQVSVGEHYMIALDNEGNIWSWGNNREGQLGNGSKGENVLVPTKITNGIKYTQISAGDKHSLALDNEGNIWSWGYNYDGELGNGSSGANANILVPTKIANGVKYTQISVGPRYSLAVDNEGNIWSWGYNSDGQLGNGESGYDKDILIPTKITNETKYQQISAGNEHSLALDNEGNIWSWGSNSEGQLGNGKSGYSENVLIPTKITNGTKYTSIVAGNYTTLALDNDGNLWICGRNYDGVLGIGMGENICVLQKLDLETKFKGVATHRTSYLIDEDGYMWSAGIPYPGRSTAYTTFQKIRI